MIACCVPHISTCYLNEVRPGHAGMTVEGSRPKHKPLHGQGKHRRKTPGPSTHHQPTLPAVEWATTRGTSPEAYEWKVDKHTRCSVGRGSTGTRVHRVVHE
jgi:hypothetical protein